MVRLVDQLDYWVQKVIPLVYDDSLSLYELVDKTVSKLNELITQSNEYFGKDLTTYVSTIIEGWRTDGTLDNIINGVFADMNTKVDNYHLEVDSLKLYVNVKKLPSDLVSAKGDGLTDDTAAIQAAITYAVDNGYNKIYIPDGTYLVNGVRNRSDITQMGNILVPSNFEIWMSENCTLQVIANDSPLYAIFNVNNADNVYIHGGKLKGDRTTHTYTQIPESDKSNEWGHGITAQNIKNSVFRDIDISDFTGDGLYIAGIYPVAAIMTENILIDNVKVNNVRRNGITIGHGKNIKIVNCTLLNVNGTNPQSGIDIEGESAASASDPNGQVDGVIIEGCYFENNSVSGVSLVNCKNINIVNNVFREQNLAVVPYWGSANVNVSHNIFTNSSYRYAIQISCPTIKFTNNFCSKARVDFYPQKDQTFLYHVLVEGNYLYDSLLFFPVTVTCYDVVIQNNHFADILNGYAAIHMVDNIMVDGLQIYGNTVRVTSDEGFRLLGNRMHIKDNFIEYAALNSIKVIAGNYLVIENNVFKDWSDGGTPSTGVFFPNSNIKTIIKNNTFEVSANGSVNPLAAIDLYTDSVDSTIFNNTVTVETRTLENGLYLNGTNIMSANNIIRGTCTTPKSGTGIIDAVTY